jgi:hypothetical protein
MVPEVFFNFLNRYECDASHVMLHIYFSDFSHLAIYLSDLVAGLKQIKGI